MIQASMIKKTENRPREEQKKGCNTRDIHTDADRQEREREKKTTVKTKSEKEVIIWPWKQR
jgi:hypothetical protein